MSLLDHDAQDLSSSINSSTRDVHTRLNRKILQLLPLALPPCTKDARLYANGMSNILPIYEAIECSLESVQNTPRNDRSQITDAVGTLYIPSLRRGLRLRRDISSITASDRDQDKSESRDSSLLNHGKESLGEGSRDHGASVARLEMESSSIYNYSSSDPSKPCDNLTNLLARIKSTTHKKPYLLLAYTHTFYLAIFSGGRHIRAELRNAAIEESGFFNVGICASDDTAFLGTDTDAVDEALTFWTFDSGTNDGETIKADFKRRFHAAAALLSADQKKEVIAEARWIMENLEGLVQGIATSAKRSQAMIASLPLDVSNPIRKSTDGPGDGLIVPSIPEARSDALYWRPMIFKHLLPMGLAELLLAMVAGIWGICHAVSGQTRHAQLRSAAFKTK